MMLSHLCGFTPTKSVSSDDPIIRRLRVIAQESPDLKHAAQLYAAILPLLRDADLNVTPVSMTPEEARAKMEMGQPLLNGVGLELDAGKVRELMIRLAAAVEGVNVKNQPDKPRTGLSNDTSPAARRIRSALKEKILDVAALLPLISAGERNQVASIAKALGLDPDLLMTLARNALKTALRACCRSLSPPAQGIPWNRGACFICGATATLAELRENHQEKHLRCGACGADWRFPRLQCMYCGNEDHKTLRHLYTEHNREKIRIEACDRCKGYLKVISSFTPTPVEMLDMEDLATLHLDYIARERGYARAGW